MEETGYLAYITSTGWIAYTAEQVRDLTAEALKTGLKYIKIKVGSDIDSDIARLSAVREVLGPDRFLMVDANQKWGVKQAIEWMERLAPFKPLWIEEPTSPDDILGHKAVRDALYPKYGIGVATGEVRSAGCGGGVLTARMTCGRLSSLQQLQRAALSVGFGTKGAHR
jgi:L-fuconate dehydratase